MKNFEFRIKNEERTREFLILHSKFEILNFYAFGVRPPPHSKKRSDYLQVCN
jgi:hypothetical protein